MKRIVLIMAVTAIALNACAKEKPKMVNEVASIAFYNLENLFDTIPNNASGRDAEFTPDGSRQWNSVKYWNKIEKLAYCISEMKTPLTPDGPAIIGVAEVENRSVMEDLVANDYIKAWNLQIVHHYSPDARGIDVGCLYNPEYFELINVTNHRLSGLEFNTRDQMCIVGKLKGQKIAVIVNHWPSRLGGQEESAPHRAAAARLTKHIADSLWAVDKNIGVVIMGDLNDDPYCESCAKVLGARRDTKGVKAHGFYNPWWKILDDGVGTLTYKGEWNLFDQIIISGNLVNGDKNQWRYLRAEVLGMDFLRERSGKYRGNPLRTFAGGNYLNGYSDHFPTCIFLTR